MSDFSQGEGWWQASDGKWYPPETAAPGYAAPTHEMPAAAVPPIAPTQPFAQPFGAPTSPPMGAPMGAPLGAPTGPLGAPLGAPTGPLGAPPIGPPPTPAKSGLGTGPIIGIVVAAVVIIGAIVFFATSGDSNKKNVAATESSSSSGSSKSSSSKSSSSSSNSSSSSTRTPSGFKQLTNASEGVSIAVPNDFKEIDPSALTNGSDQSSLSDLNPDLAPFLASGQALIGNSVLSAASTRATQIFFVTKIPGGVDPTDSEFADAIQSQLEATGLASDVSTDTVTLSAGDALKVTLTLTLDTAASSGAQVHEVLFFVKVGTTTWGIIGVSLADPGDVFDQIADTFAVTA